MKQWMAGLLLAAAVLAGSATTASAQWFDCSKASTRAERTICADETLRTLDGDMSWIYSQVGDLAADRPALVRAQRAWLAERDACADAACMARAYRRRIQALVETPRAGWTTYRDETLGITFEHLANRRVAPCGEGFERCVALYGPLFGKEALLVAFEIHDGDLETVATEHAGFELREGDGWYTTFGRFEPVRVGTFIGQGWQGMEATVTCGISDEETGFHAAAGECYWGVVSNGRRAVVISTEGIGGDDPASRRTVTSLRFLP